MGSSQIHALRMLMNIILITAIIILFIYTYYIYLYILCFSVQMSRGVPDMSLVVGPQLVAHYDAHETIDLNKKELDFIKHLFSLYWTEIAVGCFPTSLR